MAPKLGDVFFLGGALVAGNPGKYQIRCKSALKILLFWKLINKMITIKGGKGK